MKQGNTLIHTVQNDITKIDTVTAIVNAANKSLLGGGGVDGAIHRAAGKGLLAECRSLKGCEEGKAKITGAYNLPCQYVIHTVGPRWHGGKYNEADILANCYRNSLHLAVEHGIRSVAFPSISTGIYSYPLHQAATIAVNSVSKFVYENPDSLDEIVWVLFDAKTKEAYDKALNELDKSLTEQMRNSSVRKKRLAFCKQYIPVLQMIEDEPCLKQVCRKYAPYNPNNKESGVITFLYDHFMKDAYAADMVIHNYMEIYHGIIRETQFDDFSESFLSTLTSEQILGIIAFRFRQDHHNPGILVCGTVADGEMLVLLKTYVAKEKMDIEDGF